MALQSGRGRTVNQATLAREVAKLVSQDGKIRTAVGEKWNLIQIGPDELNLPQIGNQTPFIIIFYQKSGFGTQNGNQDSEELVVQYGIQSPDDKTDVLLDEGTGITTNQTAEKCAEIEAALIDALLNRMPTGIDLARGSGDIFQDAHPLYVGELLLQFNTHKLIGSKQTISSR